MYWNEIEKGYGSRSGIEFILNKIKSRVLKIYKNNLLKNEF